MIRLAEKNTWIGFALVAYGAYQIATGFYEAGAAEVLVGLGLIFSLGTEHG